MDILDVFWGLGVLMVIIGVLCLVLSKLKKRKEKERTEQMRINNEIREKLNEMRIADLAETYFIGPDFEIRGDIIAVMVLPNGGIKIKKTRGHILYYQPEPCSICKYKSLITIDLAQKDLTGAL